MDVGLPDATSENRAESPLYGELYPITKPAYPAQNSPIYAIYPITRVIRPLGPITILNIHTNYESNYIPNSYKSSNVYSHTTYIKIREFLINVDIVKAKATIRLSSKSQSLGRAVPSHAPCTCKIKGGPMTG